MKNIGCEWGLSGNIAHEADMFSNKLCIPFLKSIDITAYVYNDKEEENTFK